MPKLHDEVKYIGVVGQLVRRLVARYLLSSGKLEILRRERIAHGAPTWRLLRYEHITQPEYSPIPLPRTSYVRPHSFERHMAYLQRHCIVVPLPELVAQLEAGEQIPDRTVAITIDGGWKDAYHIAYPILSRFGLPATFFLPTAFIGEKNLFWTDKVLLVMLMLRERRRPFPPLELLGEHFYTQLRQLSPSQEITLPTIALFVHELQRLPPTKRLAILIVLGKLADEMGGIPELDLYLSWEEAQALSEGGMTLGSLGHRHVRFSEMEPPELGIDLRESYLTFHEHNLEPVKVVAFPDGVISRDARAVLHSLGIHYSLGIGEMEPPSTKRGLTPVLGRIPMFQHASFCTELFACRLWGISAFGFTY